MPNFEKDKRGKSKNRIERNRHKVRSESRNPQPFNPQAVYEATLAEARKATVLPVDDIASNERIDTAADSAPVPAPAPSGGETLEVPATITESAPADAGGSGGGGDDEPPNEDETDAEDEPPANRESPKPQSQRRDGKERQPRTEQSRDGRPDKPQNKPQQKGKKGGGSGEPAPEYMQQIYRKQPYNISTADNLPWLLAGGTAFLAFLGLKGAFEVAKTAAQSIFNPFRKLWDGLANVIPGLPKGKGKK